jgi:hypothetical protein
VTAKRVLVSDPLSPRAIHMLRAAPGLVIEERKGLGEAELLPLVTDIDAWIVRGATKVTRRLLDAAPQLRWVARAGRRPRQHRRRCSEGTRDRRPERPWRERGSRGGARVRPLARADAAHSCGRRFGPSRGVGQVQAHGARAPREDDRDRGSRGRSDAAWRSGLARSR